ncbi:hypothetical protein M8J75_005640 [Diaphorina citri]|nr:hypothetical protein M8J75_005640 [Diaphorina citri]
MSSINSVDDEDDDRFVEDIGNEEEIGIDENIEIIEVTCADDIDGDGSRMAEIETLYNDDGSSITSEFLDTDSKSQMDLIEVIANDNSESCSFSVKPQKLKQYSRKSRNSFSPLVSDDWEIDEDNLVNEVLREDRKVVVEKIIQANDLDEESQTLDGLSAFNPDEDSVDTSIPREDTGDVPEISHPNYINQPSTSKSQDKPQCSTIETYSPQILTDSICDTTPKFNQHLIVPSTIESDSKECKERLGQVVQNMNTAQEEQVTQRMDTIQKVEKSDVRNVTHSTHPKRTPVSRVTIRNDPLEEMSISPTLSIEDNAGINATIPTIPSKEIDEIVSNVTNSDPPLPNEIIDSPLNSIEDDDAYEDMDDSLIDNKANEKPVKPTTMLVKKKRRKWSLTAKRKAHLKRAVKLEIPKERIDKDCEKLAEQSPKSERFENVQDSSQDVPSEEGDETNADRANETSESFEKQELDKEQELEIKKPVTPRPRRSKNVKENVEAQKKVAETMNKRNHKEHAPKGNLKDKVNSGKNVDVETKSNLSDTETIAHDLVVAKEAKPSSKAGAMKAFLEKTMNEINIEEMYQQLIMGDDLSQSENSQSGDDSYIKEVLGSAVKKEDLLDQSIVKDVDNESKVDESVTEAVGTDVTNTPAPSPIKSRGRPRKYPKGQEPYVTTPRNAQISAEGSKDPDPVSPDGESSPATVFSSPKGRGRPRKYPKDPSSIELPAPKLPPRARRFPASTPIKSPSPIKSSSPGKRGRPRKYPRGEEPPQAAYLKKYQLNELKKKILGSQRSPKGLNSVEEQNFRGFRRPVGAGSPTTPSNGSPKTAKGNSENEPERTGNEPAPSEVKTDPIHPESKDSKTDSKADPDIVGTPNTEKLGSENETKPQLDASLAHSRNEGSQNSGNEARSTLENNCDTDMKTEGFEDETTEPVAESVSKTETTKHIISHNQDVISNDETTKTSDVEAPKTDVESSDLSTTAATKPSNLNQILSEVDKSIEQLLADLSDLKSRSGREVSKDLKKLFSLRNISLMDLADSVRPRGRPPKGTSPKMEKLPLRVERRGRPPKALAKYNVKRYRATGGGEALRERKRKRRVLTLALQLGKGKRRRRRRARKPEEENDDGNDDGDNEQKTKDSPLDSTATLEPTGDSASDRLKALENNKEIASILRKNSDFEAYYMTKTSAERVKDVERRFWAAWFEWKNMKPGDKKKYDPMSDSMSSSSISSLTSNSATTSSTNGTSTSTSSTRQFVKQKQAGLLLTGDSRICYLCLKGVREGEILRCKGRCTQTYHAACVRIVVRQPNYFATPKKKKRKRASLPEAASVVKRLKLEGLPDRSQDTIPDDPDDDTPLHLRAVSLGVSSTEIGVSLTEVKCHFPRCHKLYHETCLSSTTSHTKWSASKLESCPCHVCHMCASDNPTTSLLSSNDKYLRCVRCPSTYHATMSCIPAGTKILSAKHVLCPLHISKRNFVHFNTNWCFICTGANEAAKTLLNCRQCPVAVHPECCVEDANRFDEDRPYVCDDCKGGRFPLYGEVVWVRYGHFRWWPGQILFPEEIPDNLISKCEVGVFVVYFFGTHNYAHICKGQAYVFEEGDERHSQVKREKKRELDSTYMTSLREAAEAFREFQRNRDRIKTEETNERASRPSKYVKIKTNKPVGTVRLETDKSSTPVCECDESSPCGVGSSCINRDLYVECNPDSCPARTKCQNRDFETRNYPPLEVFNTGSRGWGLKALTDLKRGQFVVEYVGEMIDQKELNRRRRDMDRNNDHNYYFLSLDNSRYIDAGKKGNLARFMNHSCEPNCTAEKWTVSGDTRVGLFALRDVPAGTELVFNYELQKADNDGMRRCMCGAASCSGFIGAKKAVPPTSECEKGKEATRARKALKARRRNRRGASSGGEKGEVPAVVEVCERCGAEGGEMLRCALSRCRLSYHVACASIPVLPSASANPGLPSGTPVQTPTHTAPSENTGLPEGAKATLSSLSDLPGGTIGLPETIGLPTEGADASGCSTTTLPTDSNPTRSTEIPSVPERSTNSVGTTPAGSIPTTTLDSALGTSISSGQSTSSSVEGSGGSSSLLTAPVSTNVPSTSDVISTPSNSTPGTDQNKWICPLHGCMICRKRHTIKCKYCNSSYCKEHRNHLCYDISLSPHKARTPGSHASTPGAAPLSLTEREKRTLRRNCGVTSNEEIDNYIKTVGTVGGDMLASDLGADKLVGGTKRKSSATSSRHASSDSVQAEEASLARQDKRHASSDSVQAEEASLARQDKRHPSTENSGGTKRKSSANRSRLASSEESSSLAGTSEVPAEAERAASGIESRRRKPVSTPEELTGTTDDGDSRVGRAVSKVGASESNVGASGIKVEGDTRIKVENTGIVSRVRGSESKVDTGFKVDYSGRIESQGNAVQRTVGSVGESVPTSVDTVEETAVSDGESVAASGRKVKETDVPRETGSSRAQPEKVGDCKEEKREVSDDSESDRNRDRNKDSKGERNEDSNSDEIKVSESKRMEKVGVSGRNKESQSDGNKDNKSDRIKESESDGIKVGERERVEKVGESERNKERKSERIRESERVEKMELKKERKEDGEKVVEEEKGQVEKDTSDIMEKEINETGKEEGNNIVEKERTERVDKERNEIEKEEKYESGKKEGTDIVKEEKSETVKDIDTNETDKDTNENIEKERSETPEDQDSNESMEKERMVRVRVSVERVMESEISEKKDLDEEREESKMDSESEDGKKDVRDKGKRDGSVIQDSGKTDTQGAKDIDQQSVKEKDSCTVLKVSETKESKDVPVIADSANEEEKADVVERKHVVSSQDIEMSEETVVDNVDESEAKYIDETNTKIDSRNIHERQNKSAKRVDIELDSNSIEERVNRSRLRRNSKRFPNKMGRFSDKIDISTPKIDSNKVKVDPSYKPKIDGNTSKIVNIVTPSDTPKIETSNKTKANTNSTPKNDSSNKVDPSSKPKIDSNLPKAVYILTPSNTPKIETDKTEVNTNNTPKNDSGNSTPKNDSKNDNTDSPGKLSPEKLEEYFEKHNIVDCNVSLDDVIANQTTIVVSPTDKLKNVTTIVVSPDGKVVVEKKKPGEMETPEGKVKKEGEDGQTVEKIDERLERMDKDVKVLQKESTKVDKESTRPVKDERQSAKLVKDSTKPVKESPTKSVEDDLPTTNKKKKSSISKELRKLMIDMVQPANLDVLSSALSGGVHSDQQRPKRKSLKATKDLVDSKAVEANKDVEDTKSSKHIKDIETDTNTINNKDSDLGNVVESGRKVVVSKLRNIESGAEKEVKDVSEKEVLKGDNENESNPTSIGKRITRKSIKLDADSEGATEGVAPRKSLRRQQTSDDTILAGKEKIGKDSEDSLGKDFRERLRKLPEKTSVGKDSKDVEAIAVSMKKQSKEVEEMEEETDTKESLTSKSSDEPKDTSSRRRSCRQKPMGDAKDSLETADKNDNLRKTKDVSDQIQNVANEDECEDRLPTHEGVETKPNVNKLNKVTNKSDKDRDAIEADSDEEVSLLARVKNGRKSLRSGIAESKGDASEQSGKRKSSRLGTKTDGNERTDSDTSKNDGSSGKIGTRNGEYEGGVRIVTRKSEISGTTARITIPESGTNRISTRKGDNEASFTNNDGAASKEAVRHGTAVGLKKTFSHEVIDQDGKTIWVQFTKDVNATQNNTVNIPAYIASILETAKVRVEVIDFARTIDAWEDKTKVESDSTQESGKDFPERRKRVAGRNTDKVGKETNLNTSKDRGKGTSLPGKTLGERSKDNAVVGNIHKEFEESDKSIGEDDSVCKLVEIILRLKSIRSAAKALSEETSEAFQGFDARDLETARAESSLNEKLLLHRMQSSWDAMMRLGGKATAKRRSSEVGRQKKAERQNEAEKPSEAGRQSEAERLSEAEGSEVVVVEVVDKKRLSERIGKEKEIIVEEKVASEEKRLREKVEKEIAVKEIVASIEKRSREIETITVEETLTTTENGRDTTVTNEKKSSERSENDSVVEIILNKKRPSERIVKESPAEQIGNKKRPSGRLDKEITVEEVAKKRSSERIEKVDVVSKRQSRRLNLSRSETSTGDEAEVVIKKADELRVENELIKESEKAVVKESASKSAVENAVESTDSKAPERETPKEITKDTPSKEEVEEWMQEIHGDPESKHDENKKPVKQTKKSLTFEEKDKQTGKNNLEDKINKRPGKNVEGMVEKIHASEDVTKTHKSGNEKGDTVMSVPTTVRVVEPVQKPGIGPKSKVDKLKRKISFSSEVHEKEKAREAQAAREDQPAPKKRKLSHEGKLPKSASRDETKRGMQAEEKENVLKKIMEEEQKELDRILDKKRLHESGKGEEATKKFKPKPIDKHRSHSVNHHHKEKEKSKFVDRKDKKLGSERRDSHETHRTPEKAGHGKGRHDRGERSKSDEKSRSEEKLKSDEKSPKSSKVDATPDKSTRRESHDTSSKHRDKRKNEKSSGVKDKSAEKSGAIKISVGDKAVKDKNEKTPEKEKLAEKGSSEEKSASPVATSGEKKPLPAKPVGQKPGIPGAGLKQKAAGPKFFEDLDCSMATYYADLARQKKERQAKKNQQLLSSGKVKTPIKAGDGKAESHGADATSTGEGTLTPSGGEKSVRPPRTPDSPLLSPPPGKRLKLAPEAASLSPSKLGSVDLPPKKNLLKKYTFHQDLSEGDTPPVSEARFTGPLPTVNLCTFSPLDPAKREAEKSSRGEASYTGGSVPSGLSQWSSELRSFDAVGVQPQSRVSFDTVGTRHRLSFDSDFKSKSSRTSGRFSFMKSQFDEEFSAFSVEEESRGEAMPRRANRGLEPSSVLPAKERGPTLQSPEKRTPVGFARPYGAGLTGDGQAMSYRTGEPMNALSAQNSTTQNSLAGTTLSIGAEKSLFTDQKMRKKANIQALCTRSHFLQSEVSEKSGLCSIM